MSLGTQLNRIFVSLFLLTALLCSALIFFFQQQQLQTTADKLAVFLEHIAAENALTLVKDLVGHDVSAITSQLNSIVNVKGIHRTVVYDPNGHTIAAIGEPTDLPPPKYRYPPSSMHRIVGDTLIFMTPLNADNTTEGYLLLEYPLLDLKEKASRHLVFFTLSIFLLLFILLILINTFTHKSIINPLNNLIAVMSKVETGSFGRQIEVTGSHELQDLSKTFNDMSQKISLGYVKIRQSRIFVERIMDTIDSILVAIRADYVITAWNNAAVQRTGVQKNKAVGQKIFSVFKELGSFKEVINNSIHKEQPEFIHRREIAGILYNVYIYPFPDKSLSGALIRLDDITLVEEKEIQLRQAQKMETVGLLAGGVAHDFNNMLGGIMGAAELIKFKKPTQEVEGYLEIIIASCQRAADLTSKLLAFSRKSRLVTKALDVHDAIAAAIALLQRSLNKDIQITTEFQAADSVIEGDLTELQNSLLNLSINAAHAMPNGGQLTFSTRQVSLEEVQRETTLFDLAAGPYIAINVRDTGQGIAAEHLDSIFEPFFTTKTQGKGTGLGLSAVYGTVQQLHGAITVESTPGVATTFHLYFPLAKQQVAVTKASAKALQYGTGCILVVDDEVIVRTTAAEMLKTLGYRVLVAENGRKGLNMYTQQQERIDLVLLDMIMPEMNGTDCFLALRKVNPQVKVILSSGFTPGTALNKLKELGLNSFLHKPYQIQDLSTAIADVLKQDQGTTT